MGSYCDYLTILWLTLRGNTQYGAGGNNPQVQGNISADGNINLGKQVCGGGNVNLGYQYCDGGNLNSGTELSGEGNTNLGSQSGVGNFNWGPQGNVEGTIGNFNWGPSMRMLKLLPSVILHMSQLSMFHVCLCSV